MRYLEKRFKKRVIHYSLVCLAIVNLMMGGYLIVDNLVKLARGYDSNEAILLETTDELSKLETREIESNNSTELSQGLELYGMKPLLQAYNQQRTEFPKYSRPQQVTTPLYDTRPEVGEEFGELYIPKLDAVLPIFEGTSEEELELGVGHYADSVLPGEHDNSVLAGHRDTVFRRLGEVGVGDSLIVRVLGREFEYKVAKVRIVDKEDRTVIVPKPRASLTVSTCYPFSYIGAAPKRYVLLAYLIQ